MQRKEESVHCVDMWNTFMQFKDRFVRVSKKDRYGVRSLMEGYTERRYGIGGCGTVKLQVLGFKSRLNTWVCILLDGSSWGRFWPGVQNLALTWLCFQPAPIALESPIQLVETERAPPALQASINSVK